MYNLELKIPPCGHLASRARAGTNLHSLHLPRPRPLVNRNGAGCVFKNRHSKLTAHAHALIYVNVFYLRRLKPHNISAAKNRSCALALIVTPTATVNTNRPRNLLAPANKDVIIANVGREPCRSSHDIARKLGFPQTNNLESVSRRFSPDYTFLYLKRAQYLVT
jgi:hypothetical protein